MKTLIAIDNRYEDKDESRNIKAMEKVMATIPTEYSRKTLRNYISVWSAAYRILVKSRAEYDNDRFIQKKLQDCTEVDDIELFKRYNSKGHEIAGLDDVLARQFCLSLSNLAANCFPARNSGTSVSMVITGGFRRFCVSYSQSICYKLAH